MSENNNSIIAIDFGTSNTVITNWNLLTQQPEIVNLKAVSQQLGENPPLIPSLVYVEDACQGKILVGQSILDRGLDLNNDPRFFSTFKRGIGSQIQGFLPELDQKAITFEQIGEWFLQKIINALSEVPQSLILTVPVDSFESYRYWLTQVCQSWAIEQIRIVDEPTAAALGYGTNQDNLILVVDFGGGTVDLSLVELDGTNSKTETPTGLILKWGEKVLGNRSQQKARLARVLAKAGANVGGADIDNWLVDYYVETQGLPKFPLISRLVERLKVELSSQTEATEVYFDDRTFDTYELNLTRQQFEDILQARGFFTQLDDLMTQVLQQARREGVTAENIDSVLLVGGTVQIPCVQNWIQQYFKPEKIRCDHPFTAIAIGALQLAKGFEVKDFLYHSYGIRYWNRRENCHSWHPIIKTGQVYPMTESVELVLGASIPNQPSIELIIGELGSETSATEVYFDGDRLVTCSVGESKTKVQPLNDKEGARTIAQLNPFGQPGSDRIKLSFWVDDQRYLRLSVEDLLTEQTLLNNQIVTQLS